MMLFAPQTARTILRKAGSTNFINYAEITLRMIPAIAMIHYADEAKFPLAFQLFGWIMLITSFALYGIPRKVHHAFSLHSAEFLKPHFVRFISPFAFLLGGLLIYNVT